MAGGEVECDSSGFEKVSKQAEVENVLEHVNLKPKDQGELHESENVSSMENMVFPTHEKEFLTKSHTHEQLEKEAGHPLDDKLYDVSSNG
ncbi:serine-rich adhesin for platelets-like, partial [Trifolium medium]|nr:serine-rich adhesin for platelets-like [Trifolium medium]